MCPSPNTRNTTSLLLLLLIAFVSFHDGGFALLGLLDDGNLAYPGDQEECGGSACNEEETCQCPTHLLEKLDDPTAPASIARIPSSDHFSLLHDIPTSLALSPADPPPKV